MRAWSAFWDIFMNCEATSPKMMGQWISCRAISSRCPPLAVRRACWQAVRRTFWRIDDFRVFLCAEFAPSGAEGQNSHVVFGVGARELVGIASDYCHVHANPITRGCSP
jgi:hypothetical protein